MPSEAQQIQNYFKDHDIPLSTEWLESCIEWCKDGNLPPNYTLEDIQKMVIQQWLILDLRDVEVRSLPRNLSNEKKYTLTGSYCLQMMQVLDISKPKLWQLQRIRNNVAKNTETEKDFGKRVLQLTLTDGVQEVEAMEFKSISCLNINLLPGTKFRIMGPVMVRNGKLMLKEENIKRLGGSVDEIKVKFAAENVLARALGLEENPNPYTINENALEVTEETTQLNSTGNIQNYTSNQNRNQNCEPQSRNNLTTNQNVTRNTQNISRNQNIVKNINQEIPPEFQVDDDLLRELEEDFEERSITRNAENINILASSGPSSKKTSTTSSKINENNRREECSSPDLFSEIEVDDELLNEHLDQIDMDHMTSNLRSTVGSEMSRSISRNTTRMLNNSPIIKRTMKPQVEKQSTDRKIGVVQEIKITSSKIAKTNQNDNDEIIALDDSFDDIDIDLHLDNIDEEMANLPSSTQKRDDLKERLKSPELKARRIRSKYSNNISDVESPSLALNKTSKVSKKLTQGTLNFESTKINSKNMTCTSKENLQYLPSSLNFNSVEDEHENPFNTFKRIPQIPKSFGLPESSRAPKTTAVPPQKPSSITSPDFVSKNLPTTSGTISDLPQTPKLLSPESHLPGSLTSPKIANILSIEKLKKIIPNIGKGKFKINGKFKAVVEKLQHMDDRYHFVIVVEDSTEEITVQVHSDVVTNVVGVCPEELGRLRVLALQQDEEVKRQIKKENVGRTYVLMEMGLESVL